MGVKYHGQCVVCNRESETNKHRICRDCERFEPGEFVPLDGDSWPRASLPWNWFSFGVGVWCGSALVCAGVFTGVALQAMGVIDR